MIAVEFDVVEDMVGAVTDSRPSRQLFFGVNHLIRAVAKQEFLLHVSGRSGDHQFGAQLLQQRSRFQRTLKISADGHNADVEIADSQRFQKGYVGAVADLRVGHKRQYGLHPFF